MRKTVGLALCAIALGLFTYGCPKEKPAETPNGSTGPTQTAGGGKKLRIAVLPKGTAHSFWQTVKAGADAAAKEENAEIIWQGPDKETDVTAQIDIFQNQVTSKVDGIVLAATDAEALVKPAQEALAKGIPVVTLDSGLKGDISLCFVATDNVDGGRKAADALANAIGKKGNVGVLPFRKGAGSSDDREKGFMEAIAKYPDIKVVSTLYTDSDEAKALDQTTNMLTANPDIVGIFAANEPGGLGAANYLRQSKKAGKVKLVSYDASDEQLKDLKEGAIQALIVQNPYQMGYIGVKTAVKAIHKEKILEKFVNSGVSVVTTANLETPEIQKLVNPTKK